ncbi:hypothetical protein LOK49_LG13G02623 [Camellia lanceoleosa]|uniref:Uncharacterized protein n=1 Tax=Camellia lanceoleosa TaxID=1840588 RepID=A0ACC0FKN8_9ERIC|nr:hypothetical protein LOK49_LG13G02623 [Camellia lanceoleosa]
MPSLENHLQTCDGADDHMNEELLVQPVTTGPTSEDNGQVGHRKERCTEYPMTVPEKMNQNLTNIQLGTDGPGPSRPNGTGKESGPIAVNTDNFGPWTTASNRRRKPKLTKPKHRITHYKGNRFEVLQERQTQLEILNAPRENVSLNVEAINEVLGRVTNDKAQGSAEKQVDNKQAMELDQVQSNTA